MITFKKGDILREDAEALVNTVNCVGVMGRGIALQFKKAFSQNYRVYKKACDSKEIVPGKMFVYEREDLTNPRYIINFPTKRHWRGKSRLSDVQAGLTALAEEVQRLKIASIAIPPLGCGLGGLSWKTVRPLIESTFDNAPNVDITVFEPNATLDASANYSTDVPNMTPGRAALVGLIKKYLSGLLDPFVTLLEVHKLMYFLQMANEPLKLNFEKAQYGPYAENLRHVLKKVEGHLISGYKDGGDSPDKQLQLVPGAIDEARAFLSKKKKTNERISRVFELVEGFESPFGLELLASVHWIIQKEGKTDLDNIVKAVHNWHPKKQRFSKRQISLAQNRLIKKKWVGTN